MAGLSGYLSNYYRGIQGVQGTLGTQGVQGTIGTQGIPVSTAPIPISTGLPIKEVESHTFSFTDVGRFVRLKSGGGKIPGNNFNAGDVITIYNDSPLFIQTIEFTNGAVCFSESTQDQFEVIGIKQREYISVLCVSQNKFIIY